MLQKDIIKIPKNTTIIYSEKKNIITVIGNLSKKSLKTKLKIFCSKNKKTIFVSTLPISKISNKEKKNINAIKGTTLATIKLLIIETNSNLYQKLKLIGVGYRVSEYESSKENLMILKLGYSHQIHFKVSKNLKFLCIKLTKIFIFGNSLHEVTNEASKIRFFKKPEPYKGKGILYESEKIKLKEGKKV